MNMLIAILFLFGCLLILLEVFDILHLDWIVIFAPFLLMLGIYIYLTLKDVYDITKRD